MNTKKTFLKVLLLVIVIIPAHAVCIYSENFEMNISQNKSQDFSVWLIPSDKCGYYKELSACIGSLSSKSEDIFEPHITLYFGKSSDLSLDNVKEAALKIASQNRPVTLTINGIGRTQSRFKSLFLTFLDNKMVYDLSEVFRSTPGILDTGYILYPHLSLYYSPQDTEISMSEKASMLSNAVKSHPKWFSSVDSKCATGRSNEILFDRIQVRIEYDENDISKWVKLHEYKFGKED